VFTPTLTGVGERSHLLSRDVGLDSHIADVANLLIWEKPTRRRPGRTFLRRFRRAPRRRPDAGPDSLAHLSRRLRSRERQNPFRLPADNGEGDRNLAVAHGDGWRVPPRPASFFAVNAADASWVDSQCTMHPLSSFEAPAQISGACDDIANIGYIRASGFDSPFGQFYAKAGESAAGGGRSLHAGMT